MNTHTIGFYGEISKIITKSLLNMLLICSSALSVLKQELIGIAEVPRKLVTGAVLLTELNNCFTQRDQYRNKS